MTWWCKRKSQGLTKVSRKKNSLWTNHQTVRLAFPSIESCEKLPYFKANRKTFHTHTSDPY